MYESRRERLLGFVVGVALCCMISGCLSILAKKGRDQSMASARTARLATPHDEISMSSSELSDDPVNVNGSSGPRGQIRDGLMTAATLCLAAGVCCGIIAIGAILLLRRPREGYEYFSEEENSDEYMTLTDRGSLTHAKTKEHKIGKQSILRDELDEITPEEAV